MAHSERPQRLYSLARLIDARATGDPALRMRAEQEVVVTHLGLADGLAARYRERGVELADLKQVARLALVQAVKRWNPESGSFLGFAAPTITGSVKRYFRDHLYLFRVPRNLQAINREADLATTGIEEGRTPSITEVAEAIGRPVTDLEAARQARSAAQLRDIDPADQATADISFEQVEDQVDLGRAVRTLDRSERRLLGLYYFRSWSQARIAKALGVSQMQVSRAHTRVISKLRKALSVAA